MSKKGIPDCPRLSDRDGYGDADVDRYYGRDSGITITEEITTTTSDNIDYDEMYENYKKERANMSVEELEREMREAGLPESNSTEVNININLNINVDPTNKKSIQKVYDFIDDVRNRYELCDDEDEEDDEED